MMNGSKKLNAIKEQLANGKTINIKTQLSVTKITPKTVARFDNAGEELFRTDKNDSLFVRNGKRWDCIDFCRITVSA